MGILMDSRMRVDLDNHITSGRYRSEYLLVTCFNCRNNTVVEAETEYGATTWTPEECSNCLEPFEGDEDWEVYDPKYDI